MYKLKVDATFLLLQFSISIPPTFFLEYKHII